MPFKKSTKRPKNFRKRGRKPAKVSSNLKQYINKTIARQAETKVMVISGACPVNCYSVITPASVRTLAPVMLQGTGEGQRIGNKITIRKVLLRGHITLATGATTPYPNSYNTQFNCKMFIGHIRYAPPQSPNSGDLSKLLRSGNTSSDFGQDLLSLMKPINKDYWVINNQRTFKIGISSGAGSSQLTGSANNDYSMSRMFRIDITKAYKKTIRYSDNTATPENMGLFIFAGATDMIGSPTNYGQVAGINFEYEVYYDDE